MGQPELVHNHGSRTREWGRGLVFNVMQFALHDGPGIRTTVFLKGCPLDCWWCHNPESRSPRPQVVYVSERCIRCGECVGACPENALQMGASIERDLHRCRLHGTCVDVCPAGAQEIIGRWMSVAEVMAEIRKDLIFFDESSGGMTVSGGEPLLQADFVESLLAACRAERIHTTLDTCGFADIEVFDRIRPNVDLFLFDLKIMDPAKHRQFTGVLNDCILANLRLLAEKGSAVVVRIPVIPGVNDDDDNLAAVSDFLSPLGLRKIDLLPYHSTASGKYAKLSLRYRVEDVNAPSAEHMNMIAERFIRDGFDVHIGGLS